MRLGRAPGGCYFSHLSIDRGAGRHLAARVKNNRRRIDPDTQR